MTTNSSVSTEWARPVGEHLLSRISEHLRNWALRDTQPSNNGLSMAASGITSVDELRVLGSCYVPPPDTPAAKLVRKSLGSRSPQKKRAAARA